MAVVDKNKVTLLEGGEVTYDELNAPVDTLVDELNDNIVTEEQITENQHGGSVGDVIFSKTAPGEDYIPLDSLIYNDLNPELASKLSKISPARMREAFSVVGGHNPRKVIENRNNAFSITISFCDRFIGVTVGNRVFIYKRSPSGWDLYINKQIPGGFFTILGRGAFSPDSRKYFICSNSPNMHVIDVTDPSAPVTPYDFSNLTIDRNILPPISNVKIHEKTGNMVIYGNNGIGGVDSGNEAWILIEGGLYGNGSLITRASNVFDIGSTTSTYPTPTSTNGGVEDADFSPCGRYLITAQGRSSNVNSRNGVRFYDLVRRRGGTVRSNYDAFAVKFVDENSFVFAQPAVSGNANNAFCGIGRLWGDGSVTSSFGPSFGTIDRSAIGVADILVDGRIVIFCLTQGGDSSQSIVTDNFGTNPRAVYARLNATNSDDSLHRLSEYSGNLIGLDNFFKDLGSVNEASLSNDGTFAAFATRTGIEFIDFPYNQISKMPGYIDGGILTDKGVKAYVKAK